MSKGKTKKRRGILKEMKRNKQLYLMFLPAAIFFILFAYVPMPGIIVDFKRLDFSNGIYGSP